MAQALVRTKPRMLSRGGLRILNLTHFAKAQKQRGEGRKEKKWGEQGGKKGEQEKEGEGDRGGEEGKEAGRQGDKGRRKTAGHPGGRGRAPRTAYRKGLALQMVTAGKSMALKPTESETLTSQLR